MNYWWVKQEPAEYAWAGLVHDSGTAWTGVRNFQARNHLRAMRRGDPALFHHSDDAKQVAGIARVTRAAYLDPVLQTMPLVRQSRLSVCPVTAAQFRRIRALGTAPATP